MCFKFAKYDSLILISASCRMRLGTLKLNHTYYTVGYNFPFREIIKIFLVQQSTQMWSIFEHKVCLPEVFLSTLPFTGNVGLLPDFLGRTCKLVLILHSLMMINWYLVLHRSHKICESCFLTPKGYIYFSQIHYRSIFGSNPVVI